MHENNMVYSIKLQRHFYPKQKIFLFFFYFRRNVVYYNSLAQAREEIVRLYVSHPHVEVKDSSGKVVESQVDPFWDNNENYNLQTYKVGILRLDPGYF